MTQTFIEKQQEELERIKENLGGAPESVMGVQTIVSEIEK